MRFDADGDEISVDDDDASTTRPAPIVASVPKESAPRGPKLAQAVDSTPRGKRVAAPSQPRMQAVPDPSEQAFPDPSEQAVPQIADEVDTAPITARSASAQMRHRVANDDDIDGLEEETDCMTVVENAESLVEQLARDIEAHSDVDRTRIDVPLAEESEMHAVAREEQTAIGHRAPNWSDPRELEEPIDWTGERAAAPEPVAQSDTKPIKLSALVTAQAEPISRPAVLGNHPLAGTESVPAMTHGSPAKLGRRLPWGLVAAASGALVLALVVTLAIVL